MSEVEITTDGSCLGNPGPGGWACILRCGQHERVLQGGVADTTNNRMELVAAIEGLRALKRASQVTVLTDSEYVRRGITEFLPRWKANGWRASTGKPVVNRDLWEELEELAGRCWFGLVAAVHDIALPPRPGFREQVAAQEIEREELVGAGEVGESRRG